MTGGGDSPCGKGYAGENVRWGKCTRGKAYTGKKCTRGRSVRGGEVYAAQVFQADQSSIFIILHRSHTFWAITSVKHFFLSFVKNKSKNESLLILLIKSFACYDYIWLQLWIFTIS